MKESNIEKTLLDGLVFHMIMAFIGGFMDVYSYVVRGNVFATGQTGNFVLIAIRFLEQNYGGAVSAAIPVAAFWAGVFVSRHLSFRVSQRTSSDWICMVLILEAAVLLLVGFLPASLPHRIANTAVSFTAAMQFCSFRRFGGSQAYAPVFCTGNMRSCAEMYYDGFVRKSPECRRKAYHYTAILVSFFAGSLYGGLCSMKMGEKAIWIAAFLLIFCLAMIDRERRALLRS